MRSAALMVAAALAAASAAALLTASRPVDASAPFLAPPVFAQALPGALYAVPTDGGAGSPLCVAESALEPGAVFGEGLRTGVPNEASLATVLADQATSSPAPRRAMRYFTDHLSPGAASRPGERCEERLAAAHEADVAVCLVESVMREEITGRVVAVRFSADAFAGGSAAPAPCPLAGAETIAWPVERRLIALASN